MKGLVFICPVLNAGNQRVRKQIIKGIKSHYKTRQNRIQKMSFYLSIHGLLKISEKQHKKSHAACGTIGQRCC